MFIYTDAGDLNLRGVTETRTEDQPLSNGNLWFLPTFSGYKGTLDSVGHDQYCTIFMKLKKKYKPCSHNSINILTHLGMYSSRGKKEGNLGGTIHGDRIPAEGNCLCAFFTLARKTNCYGA